MNDPLPQHAAATFSDEHWMREALLEARCCLRSAANSSQFTSPAAPVVNRQSSIHNRQSSDVPIGALCVRQNQIVARAHNRREVDGDPIAHAEVLALREAARVLGTRHLTDVTLYVTLEPCAMCAGAIWLARLHRVVFGAWDDKAGACGSLFDIARDPRLNHRPELRGGVLETECSALLKEFFVTRRKQKNAP